MLINSEFSFTILSRHLIFSTKSLKSFYLLGSILSDFRKATSSAVLGSRPYVTTYGDRPVASTTEIFIAYLASARLLSLSFLSKFTYFDNILSADRLVLST